MWGKVIAEIRNFLESGGGTWVWDHEVGGSGFSGRDFDTSGCFNLRLFSSQLRGCCVFGFRLLRPVRLLGGGHFRFLGSFRDRMGRGIWNIVLWGSGLVNTPTLERRDFTTCPGPSALQMAQPAVLSER
jgi:hypothetical protein